MTFDYGNLLTRAWQITWKHKILWVFSAAPMLVSMLFFPVFALPILFIDEAERSGFHLNGALAGLIVFLFLIVFSIANVFVSAYAMSAATLGVVRAERGEGSLAFMDLLRDGTKYFGRVLIIMLIISLTIGMIFTLFFLCVFAAIAVTMGMAAICMQPVILILTPLSFLVVAAMESAQAAVIADDMNAMDALKRAFQLMRQHIWKYIVITLIVYFGSTILTSFIVAPMMVPFFALSFLTAFPGDIDPRTFALIPLGFMCIFFPVMFVIQSIVLTFMKSSLVVAYTRLTYNSENQVIVNGAHRYKAQGDIP